LSTAKRNTCGSEGKWEQVRKARRNRGREGKKIDEKEGTRLVSVI